MDLKVKEASPSSVSLSFYTSHNVFHKSTLFTDKNESIDL